MARDTRSSHTATALAAVLALGFTPAAATAAPESSRWQVRAELAAINPTGSLVTTPAVGDSAAVDIDPGVGLGFATAFRLRERVSLEAGLLLSGSLSVGTGRGAGVDLDGFAPLTLTLKFHFPTAGRAEFHAGPLIGVVNHGGLDIRGGRRGGVGESESHEFTWGLAAGLDYRLGQGGWFAHAGLRYLSVDYDGGERSGGEVDPWIVAAGFGYRF